MFRCAELVLLLHILLKYQDVFLIPNAIGLTGPGGFDRDPCMVKEPIKFGRQRAEMVKKHIEARGITDPLVLDAMRTVQRHLFVSEALADQAYGDYPLPIGDQQTISQPYIVAEMTQALELKPDEVIWQKTQTSIK